MVDDWDGSFHQRQLSTSGCKPKNTTINISHISRSFMTRTMLGLCSSMQSRQRNKRYTKQRSHNGHPVAILTLLIESGSPDFIPIKSKHIMASSSSPEPFGEKMKRLANNCFQSTNLCCTKVKEQSQIALLEQKIVSRQRQFGVDYINLVDKKASQEELKECLKRALSEINGIQSEINSHYDNLDEKEAETKSKIIPPTGGQQASSVTASEPSINQQRKKPPIKDPLESQDFSSPTRSPRKKEGPSFKRLPSKPTEQAVIETNGPKSPTNQSKRKTTTKKSSAGKNEKSPEQEVRQLYRDADPSKWKIKEYTFQGSASYDKKGKEETIAHQSISEAIKRFKANPGKYTALLYQTSMITEGWPTSNHKYTLIHREGTENYKPQGISPSGWMTILLQEYERLPPFSDDVLPKQFRDNYTDSMTFQNRKLHSKSKPIMPGRGMGFGDIPSLKVIGDVDPSDIFQGQVGNCWMLSGISSLAEFDGAILKLFRKTKRLEEMPRDGPNKYTVTLWDLKTWKEVDIEIDERLARGADGNLLGSKPSEDGELWVPYLEKALSIHCGGWDKIVGGQCTHAWALLTGCKEQYTIQRDKGGKKYACSGKFDPYKKKWADLGNSPHDSDGNMWHCPWPEAGGGGGADLRLTEDEVFERMVAWDKRNYIVAAGTKGTSDKHKTGGLVDNHAYSVIESHSNVAGSGIDLLKVSAIFYGVSSCILF